LATVMTDDGTAMMNDDHRRFDWRLDRFRKHRARLDRRRFRDTCQHAERQRGGDSAVSDAFQHPELIFKRHFASSRFRVDPAPSKNEKGPSPVPPCRSLVAAAAR
jgi:hypothetical protein